jgi:rhomboid protease GluP
MPARFQSCPNCRALLDPRESVCPYCATNLGRPSIREVELGSSGTPGVVTGYLIGICVLFFILEMVAMLGAEGARGIWTALLSVDPRILVQMGARFGPLVQAGEWWRLVVPVFLHGGVLHILFNGMALVQVGPLAERAYGRARFLLIFIVAGVAGNLLGLRFYGGGVGIGASGALFGLIGAAGVYGHRRGDAFGRMIRRVMLQWGLYALVFGLLIHADNAAHIGGLAAGVVLSFVVGDTDRPRPLDRLWPALAAVAVAITLFAFVMAVYGFAVWGPGAAGTR